MVPLCHENSINPTISLITIKAQKKKSYLLFWFISPWNTCHLQGDGPTGWLIFLELFANDGDLPVWVVGF